MLSYESFSSEEVSILRNMLGVALQKEASKYKFSEDQDRFVIRRAALLSCLADYLRVAPEHILLERMEQGKLYLPNHPQVSFSLSHTKAHTLIAISENSRVGIDIEERGRTGEVNSCMDSFLGSDEQELIGAKGVSPLVAWTAKEAFLKAAGTGFNVAELPKIVGINRKAKGIYIVDLEEGRVIIFDKVLPHHLVAVCPMA